MVKVPRPNLLLAAEVTPEHSVGLMVHQCLDPSNLGDGALTPSGPFTMASSNRAGNSEVASPYGLVSVVPFEAFEEVGGGRLDSHAMD